MRVDLLNEIYNDGNLRRFLYEESYWYKYLNRDYRCFNDFVREMKNKYKLSTNDKINKVISNIGMLQTFLNVLK